MSLPRTNRAMPCESGTTLPPPPRIAAPVMHGNVGTAIALISRMSSPGKECRLREHLRTLLEEAACAAERQQADPFEQEIRVTSDVIRLARLATSMHLTETVARRAAGFRDDHPSPRRELLR